MMNRYDPNRRPDPAQWLALDESERLHLVKRYHRRARVKLPNATLHALFHVVVENQVAEGEALPVQGTLDRLVKEGLDRHEAVHAIGSVLAGLVYHVLKRDYEDEDPNPTYYHDLEELTAEAWMRSGETLDDEEYH